MSIENLIKEALKEDLGEGDHTTLATIAPGQAGEARLLIKEPGILAGVPVAEEVFRITDPLLLPEILITDGSPVAPGDIVFKVRGPLRSILSAERTVLNFMQRLSGIATETHRMVQAIEGTHAKILDTRKTTPGLRELEKYAVRIGGAENHRFGLFDMIMIKDNHVDFAGGISNAIRLVTNYLDLNNKSLKVEIEVRSFTELREVLEVGNVDRIMLDNFTSEELRSAMTLIGRRFETEASGGITLRNIRQYAETGVDYISVGHLTHHIKSLDMSLKSVIDRR